MTETYNVRIRGLSPLLMHSPAGLGKSSSKQGVIPSPEAEAEAGLYRDETGRIVVPARCIEAALAKASTALKAPGKGRKSLMEFIAGGTMIEPLDIPLESGPYVVDTRRAVINRSGVLRSRPKFNEWALGFQLVVTDEYLYGRAPLLKDLINEAGLHAGILDFRPQRKGKFGRFQVESFELVKGE